MASQPRLVIGSDDAGFQDEEALTSDLQVDLPVTSVVDIGVDRGGCAPELTAAVEAAQGVADGRADRALVLCGTDLELAHRLGHEWLTHRWDTALDGVAEAASLAGRAAA